MSTTVTIALSFGIVCACVAIDWVAVLRRRRMVKESLRDESPVAEDQ